MKKTFRFRNIFNMITHKRAFTLIELVITVTIFTIIIVTVCSSFYMGVKAWRRGEAGGSLTKIRTGFLKMEKELKGSFYFSNTPFSGTGEEMSFPLSLPEGDSVKIHVVTYSINKDEGTGQKQLVRKEKVFNAQPEPGEVAEDEKSRILLSSADDIRFEYAYAAGDISKGVEWQGEWDAEKQRKIPSVIKICMDADSKGTKYNKVIFIKQGALGVK